MKEAISTLFRDFVWDHWRIWLIPILRTNLGTGMSFPNEIRQRPQPCALVLVPIGFVDRLPYHQMQVRFLHLSGL